MTLDHLAERWAVPEGTTHYDGCEQVHFRCAIQLLIDRVRALEEEEWSGALSDPVEEVDKQLDRLNRLLGESAEEVVGQHQRAERAEAERDEAKARLTALQETLKKAFPAFFLDRLEAEDAD